MVPYVMWFKTSTLRGDEGRVMQKGDS